MEGPGREGRDSPALLSWTALILADAFKKQKTRPCGRAFCFAAKRTWVPILDILSRISTRLRSLSRCRVAKFPAALRVSGRTCALSLPLGLSLHSLLRKEIIGLVALATCETALTSVQVFFAAYKNRKPDLAVGLSVLRRRGLEPPFRLRNQHLKLACLPVSPSPQVDSISWKRNN